MDTLCGTTLTESITLEADVDCTRFTGVAITVGASGVTLDGNGYRLLAPDATRAIQIVGVDDVTVQNLEVLGWCTGVGIYIDGGAGHTLTNIDATGRSIGVEARNTSGLTISGLTATAASDVGLLLQSVSLPLSLQGLDLTNNLTGLRIHTFTGPFTLDADAVSDIRGSDTGIHLQANVHDLTIEGLTIDGDSFGINANVASVSGLTFRDLDLSGRIGTGTGLTLRGDGHVLEHIRADRRSLGVTINLATDLTLHHIQARGCVGSSSSTGLTLTGITAPLSLLDLDLSHNTRGFVLSGFDAPPGYAIDGYDPMTNTGVITSLVDSDTGLYALDTQNVTFRGFAANGSSFGVHAGVTNNANLTFEDLDLSSTYRVGTGLYLRGSDHTVVGVTIRRRTTALHALTVSGLSIGDLTVTASSTGLLLQTQSLPLSLTALDLRDNGTGLSFNGFAGDPDAPFQLGPWDPDTGVGAIRHLEGNGTSLQLASTQHLRIHDLELSGHNFGLDASSVANDHITLERVDLTGPRLSATTSRGLRLGGSNHTLKNVVVTHRHEGLRLYQPSHMILQGVTAEHNSSWGLRIDGLTASSTAPVFQDVSLRNNNRALELHDWHLPYTFDADTDIDLSGSLTGIYLIGVQDVTFRGLVLDQYDAGINVAGRCERLTFEDLDVSGHGRGTGISLSAGATSATMAGVDHLVRNVTANRRHWGVNASYTSGLVIENLTAQSCRIGLNLANHRPVTGQVMTAPILSGLDLRHNDEALRLDNILLPLTIDSAADLDTSNSETSVRISTSVGLTLRDLTLPGWSHGILVWGNSSNLRFENLDLSGAGSGIGLRIGSSRAVNINHSNNGGQGHVLEQVIADNRSTGFMFYGVHGLEATDLQSEGSMTGMLLNAHTVPPTLRRLRLADNHVALQLQFIEGTAANPFVVDPWDSDTGLGVVERFGNSGTTLSISSSSHVQIEDLTLDGDTFGLDASSGANSHFTLRHLDASAPSGGTGIRLDGDHHTLEDIDLHHRAAGLHMRYAANATLSDIRGHANSGNAIYLQDAALPLTLSGLELSDNNTALAFHNLSGAGPLALDTGTFALLTRNATAISISNSPAVQVDDVGLDLIESAGNYQNEVPPSDPLCGSSLTESLTLTADLDCSGTTGTILTLAEDGITLDGAGHRIIAPLATRVLQAVNRSDLTIRDVDVSATRIGGTGVDISGGAGHLIQNIRADRRATAALVSGAEGVTIHGLTADATSGQGLQLTNISGPLSLGNLSLTRSLGNGLVISGFDGLADDGVTLFELEPSLFSDLSGNATSIRLSNDVRNVRVRDLHLDGLTYGLVANHASNEGLVIEDLHLGPWRRSSVTSANVGLLLSGTGHQVRHLSGAARYKTVDVTNATDLTVHDVEGVGIGWASVHLTNVDGALHLSKLRCVDCATVLRLQGVSGTEDAPFVIGHWDASSGTGIFDMMMGIGRALYLGSSTHILIDGLVLPEPTTVAVDASLAGNTDLVVTNLDVSGRAGLGTGLLINGEGLRVEDVVARDRSTGVSSTNATNLTMKRIDARRSYSTGVSLSSVDAPLTLEDLEVSGSYTGLTLSGFDGDGTGFILDGWDPLLQTGVLRSSTTTHTTVNLSNVQDIEVANLSATGRSIGIDATSTSNARITFRDLDASWHTGTGITLWGDAHRIERVTARRRDNGITARYTPELSVVDSDLSRGGTALWLRDIPPASDPPTLVGLDLRESTLALTFWGTMPPLTLDDMLDVDLTGSASQISMSSTTGGHTLRALDLSPKGGGTGIALSGGATASLIEDCTVSGDGGGTGIALSGSGATLRRVRVEGHLTGLSMAAADSIILEDLTATLNGRGIYLTSMGAAATPPSLSALDLRDNDMAFRIDNSLAPWTLSAGDGIDVSGSRTGLYLRDSRHITLTGLSLPATVTGLWANRNANEGFVLHDLELSGTGRGTGLLLAGSDHLLDGLIVRDRQTGISVGAGSGGAYTLRDIELDGISGTALSLSSAEETAPVLEDLRIRGSNTALALQDIAVPLTLDPSVLSEETGNRTSVDLSGGNVDDLTLSELVLSGSVVGLRMTADSGNAPTPNANTTISGVDFSGQCRGTGLVLGGTDITVTGAIIARRQTGALLRWTGPYLFEESIVGANVTGVSVVNHDRRLNATVVSHASNSPTFFHVSYPYASSLGPLPPASVRVSLPGGDVIVPVQSASLGTTSGTVTLAAPLGVTPEPGTAVVDPLGDTPRVTVETSDFCANGTAYTSTAGNVAAATGNYWRSSDGPLHPDNAAGTGDSIDATDITFDPWQPVPTDKTNHYCNQAPVADAGEDQEVCEGDEVPLDASASYDPDIEPLDFTWTQREGSAVTLTNADQELATFTAPTPAGGADNELFVFRVRADDGHLWRTDDTEVLVLKGNAFPEAVPGADQTVDEGDPVSLDGGASFDPEEQPLSYLWQQVSGPAVTLTGANTATPSFTAPLLDVGGAPVSEDIVLSLTVTDVPLPEHCGGPRSHTETVTITVHNVNQAPIADAGDDQQALEAVTVSLNANGSSDPDGDTLTFAWVQLSGWPVTLTGADTATPSFTSPTAPPDGDEVLVFQVTAFDGFGGSDTDTVTVTILVDYCPDDPDKMEPGECGCGVVEDTGDDDGDGVINCLDGCPQDPDKIDPGVCGCGTPDTDTDGDGVPDCIDGCPLDPLKTEPGLCGCGVIDDPTDTDGDGVPDCLDGCPEDPDKVEPGQCGCGMADTDSTGDGIADCLSDCAHLPDGTIVTEEVPCGIEGCGEVTGTEFCEGGLLWSTCDAAYEAIPDTSCGVDEPTVAYAIAFTPQGEPFGTIRCTRDPDGVVTCDTRPDDPSTLLIHEGLFCPGYSDSW